MTQNVFLQSLASVFCDCSAEEFIKKCDSYGVKNDVLAIAKWIETNVKEVSDLYAFVENSRKCAVILESVSVNPAEYSDNVLYRDERRLNSVFGAFYRMCEDVIRSNVHFAFGAIICMFVYVNEKYTLAQDIERVVLCELKKEDKA